MDGRRFDGFARRLAATRSRRGVLVATAQWLAASVTLRYQTAEAAPHHCSFLGDGVPCAACGVCQNDRCLASAAACSADACLRCDTGTLTCISRCKADQFCAAGQCVDTLPCLGAGCAPGDACSCPIGTTCCDGVVCCPEALCCNGVCGGKSPTEPCCQPGQQPCNDICCSIDQKCCEFTGSCLSDEERCCPECTEDVDGQCVPTDRFDYCGPTGEDRCCQGTCLPYNAAYRRCYPCEKGSRRCEDSPYGDLGDCCPIETTCCNGFCCGNPAFICEYVGSGGNITPGDYTCRFP